MATHYFTGAIDGQFDVAGNFDSAIPGAADTLKILDTNKTIVDVPSDSGELAYANVYTGPKFTGVLASSSLPFFLGSVTGVVEIDSPNCEAMYWAIGTTRTVPQFTVRRNGGTELATVIAGPGTITKLTVYTGYVKVLASAVLTSLEVGPDAMVVIESGATVGEIMTNGYVDSEAAVSGDVIVGPRGTLNQVGETTFNIGGTLFNFGTANLFSNGGTFAEVVNWGLLDLDGGSGKGRTISSLTRMPGGKVRQTGLGATVTITADKVPGGDVEP